MTAIDREDYGAGIGYWFAVCPNFWARPIGYIHHNRANVLWVDGHVSSEKKDYLEDAANVPGLWDRR